MPPWLPLWRGFSLVDDSGSYRGDSQSSIARPLYSISLSTFSSHRLSHAFQPSNLYHCPDPSSYCSHIVSSAAHSSSRISDQICSNQVSYPPRPMTPQPSSSPINQSSIQTTLFTGLLEQGNYREESEAVGDLRATQARPSVPIFSNKTTKSHKKVISLAPQSCVHASCIPSSFS